MIVEVVDDRNLVIANEINNTVVLAEAISLGGGSATSIGETRILEAGVLTYLGAAEAPGTLDSAPLWRVRRVDSTIPASLVVTSAGGLNAFSFVWDNVLTLTYS